MWLDKAKGYVFKATIIFLKLFLFVFCIRFFLLDFGVVSGPSMEPNFRDGHYFLLLKLPLFVAPPRRFDTVQLMNPRDRGTLIVKRVIGLPGETVIFRQNQVCVSGQGQPEHCLKEDFLGPGTITQSRSVDFRVFKVPSDSYFVLGDNRRVSADSRDYGPIGREYILGVAYPL